MQIAVHESPPSRDRCSNGYCALCMCLHIPLAAGLRTLKTLLQLKLLHTETVVKREGKKQEGRDRGHHESRAFWFHGAVRTEFVSSQKLSENSSVLAGRGRVPQKRSKECL